MPVPLQHVHLISTCTPYFLSLQGQSPITNQTAYQACQGQAIILYSKTCTPSFPYKDKVPLLNRQAIQCSKAKQSFYTPITNQTGYQVCQGQVIILYSKACTHSFQYTLFSLQVPLQNRPAIKCTKAKQSFYTSRHATMYTLLSLQG